MVCCGCCSGGRSLPIWDFFFCLHFTYLLGMSSKERRYCKGLELNILAVTVCWWEFLMLQVRRLQGRNEDFVTSRFDTGLLCMLCLLNFVPKVVFSCLPDTLSFSPDLRCDTSRLAGSCWLGFCPHGAQFDGECVPWVSVVLASARARFPLLSRVLLNSGLMYFHYIFNGKGVRPVRKRNGTTTTWIAGQPRKRQLQTWAVFSLSEAEDDIGSLIFQMYPKPR